MWVSIRPDHPEDTVIGVVYTLVMVVLMVVLAGTFR